MAKKQTPKQTLKEQPKAEPKVEAKIALEPNLDFENQKSIPIDVINENSKEEPVLSISNPEFEITSDINPPEEVISNESNSFEIETPIEFEIETPIEPIFENNEQETINEPVLENNEPVLETINEPENDEETEVSLNLDRPIIFFDLETTGLDTLIDRIVAIACRKLNPDGTVERKGTLINPKIPISKEATEIHHITDEMVADKPTFKQIAKSMHEFFKDCDIAGFNNNHYDNVMLSEEFARANFIFPDLTTNSVDVGMLYKIFFPRTLTAAMKEYCEVDNFEETAHDADADTEGTLDVFLQMLSRHPELQDMSISDIATKCKKNPNQVDSKGQLLLDADGDICFGFGKPKGKKVKEDLSFANWILEKDFSAQVKMYVKLAIEKAKETNPELF